MEPKQFDTITRHLAAHRRSRRSAILAGLGLAATSVAGAAAQATSEAQTDQVNPDESPRAGVPFMFVQTLGAGSIDAATDGTELLLLVADHVAGQTLYFSDRPERIVGMVPTEDFLTGGADGGGLGFSPADPPNAALVLPDNQILIVELIEPTYDVATGQVRYQLRVLEDVLQVDLQLETEPLEGMDAVGEFTAASLFIDDCPDGQVNCYAADGSWVGTIPSSGNMGFCWNYTCCAPCEAPGDGDWSSVCNQTFEPCRGACYYHLDAAFAC